MSMDYPQFRKLEGAPNLYIIEGPKHVTEWQPMGDSKWVVHQHYASDYPRYQWVSELLQGDDPVRFLNVDTWKRLLNERSVASADEIPGRTPYPTNQGLWRDNAPVGALTTFGAEARASCIFDVKSDADVRWALQDRDELPLMVLGGGSNVLMCQDWAGRMLHMNILGIQKVTDDGNAVEVVVGAGESWHAWVMHALECGWNGLENLALIPGSVGASPMQNIGAYGVEVKDRFAWLEAIHRDTGALERFEPKRCAFGYRDSVFKQSEKEKWVIVRVAFSLERTAPLNTQYGVIQSELQSRGWDRGTTHRQVAEVVMAIRQSKLPDPREIGNAGSFFKNPVVSKEVLTRIQRNHPEVVYYPAPDGGVKLAAGWLIDRAGWKGHRRGACGVHDQQALVLVNYGGATGAEIWALAHEIMEDIVDKYGVQLVPEVNQVGL